jgi:hypothetical protein
VLDRIDTGRLRLVGHLERVAVPLRERRHPAHPHRLGVRVDRSLAREQAAAERRGEMLGT